MKCIMFCYSKTINYIEDTVAHRNSLSGYPSSYLANVPAFQTETKDGPKPVGTGSSYHV